MKKFKIHNKKTSTSTVKKEKRKVGIMGYTIIFIMVSSIIGFLYVGNTETVEKYNDQKFTRNGNNWFTEIDGKEVAFNYFPNQVEDIELDEATKDLLNAPQLKLTHKPNQNFVSDIDVSKYLFTDSLKDSKFIEIGIAAENTYNSPIITCQDATSSVPVIEFMVGNETKITSENNCIFVTAKNGFEFIRAKDRMLYSIYGVV